MGELERHRAHSVKLNDLCWALAELLGDIPAGRLIHEGPEDPMEYIPRLKALIEGEWEPGRWWNVVGPDGKLWCGTSDEDEARSHMRPGDELHRQWVRHETEWRTA